MYNITTDRYGGFYIMANEKEWINFKVDKGERERIKQEAHANNMNISEYIRWLIELRRNTLNIKNTVH